MRLAAEATAAIVAERKKMKKKKLGLFKGRETEGDDGRETENYQSG